jgi:uncharacterized protein YlxW (UPF0749 family)
VIKGAGVVDKDAVTLIRCAREIPQLKNGNQNLKNENTGLERQRNRLLSDLYYLQDKVEELRGHVQYYQNELNKKHFERMALDKEVHDLEELDDYKWRIYGRLRFMSLIKR